GTGAEGTDRLDARAHAAARRGPAHAAGLIRSTATRLGRPRVAHADALGGLEADRSARPSVAGGQLGDALTRRPAGGGRPAASCKLLADERLTYLSGRTRPAARGVGGAPARRRGGGRERQDARDARVRGILDRRRVVHHDAAALRVRLRDRIAE